MSRKNNQRQKLILRIAKKSCNQKYLDFATTHTYVFVSVVKNRLGARGQTDTSIFEKDSIASTDFEKSVTL